MRAYAPLLAALLLLAAILPAHAYTTTTTTTTTTVYTSHAWVTLLDTTLTVPARQYVEREVLVKNNWENPKLCYTIQVLNGKDIRLVVKYNGADIFRQRITSGKSCIDLPGPGLYTVELDNTYSIFTSKPVRAYIAIIYTTRVTRTITLTETLTIPNTTTTPATTQGTRVTITLNINKPFIATIALAAAILAIIIVYGWWSNRRRS